jgi:hypothetical protein
MSQEILLIGPHRKAITQYAERHPEPLITYLDDLLSCIERRPFTDCNTVTVIDHDKLTTEQLLMVRELQRAGFGIIHYETPKS